MATSVRGGIYRIVSSCGRQYVGSARDLRKRWLVHRRDFLLGKHHSRFMQRIFDKYGADALRFEVLLYCRTDDLLWYEQRALDCYAPELNTALVAGSLLGTRRSEESKARMRAVHLGKPSGFKGWKHSPESLAKLSQNRKGKGKGPYPPERCAKVGAAQRGKTISMEQRAKISATLTGTSTGRGQLTPDQVRSIRELRATTGLGKISIGRLLNIKASAVGTVLGGHAYGWVS